MLIFSIEQKGSGKVIHYVLNEWKTFVRFTSDFPDFPSDLKLILLLKIMVCSFGQLIEALF